MSILALSLAMAGSLELGAEAGWLGSPDDAWRQVSGGALYGTGGLRLGLPLGEKLKPLTALVGWQHGRTGVDVYATEDGGDETDTLRTAFVGNQILAGLKAEAKVARWFRPYVTAQASLLVATVKLDNDPSEDDNLGQRRVGGVTGGGYFAGGAAFPIDLGSLGVAIAPYTEMGYGILAPVRFEELGGFQLRGYTGRLGLSLRL